MTRRGSVADQPSGLLVIRSGLFTTFQDRGRPGFRAFGVPLGGAFDPAAHDLANALVGNEADCTTLEMTLLGGAFEATASVGLAIAGAAMPGRVTRRGGRIDRLNAPSSTTLLRGERLEFGPAGSGARAYLAVRGGWKAPFLLGSTSSEVPLKAGTILAAEPSAEIATRRLRLEKPIRSDPNRIRVIPGPEYQGSGSAGLVQAALGRDFQVSNQCNRMGIRLNGEPFPLESAGDSERISSPVAPGAIQWTGGLPIILGVACGTMGGYSHVGHVISADLAALGRLRPGDRVRFEMVSLAEARRLDRLARQTHAELLLRIRTAVGDRIG